MFSADTAIITWKVFLYLTQREHEKCFQKGSERNIVEYTFYIFLADAAWIHVKYLYNISFTYILRISKGHTHQKS